MGFVSVLSACFGCKRPFLYNPLRVPSITIHGQREPICAACVERVNPARIRNGLDPITILPGAYEPLDEHELPNDD